METEFAEKYDRSPEAAARAFGADRVPKADDITDTVQFRVGEPSAHAGSQLG